MKFLTKLISAKIAPYTIGGAFLIGTFGGGWAVNKFWLGANAQKALKAEQAALKATEKALTDTQERLVASTERAERESMARSEAEQRLSRAYADNANLAASRAATSTRVIQEAQDIGQNLKTEYPCLYEPWPRQLRLYTFGLDAALDMSSTAVSGYPAPE